MIYNDKKLDYMLGLDAFGRVISGNGTLKADSGNKTGGRVKVPPGVVVHDTEKNATYGPNMFFLANKANFDAFREWVNEGGKGTERWVIEETGDVPEYKRKIPGVTETVLKAQQNTLSQLVTNMVNHFEGYAKFALNNGKDKELSEEDERKLSKYILMSRASYENALLTTEDGEFVVDEDGNPSLHPNRDVILAAFDAAAERVENSLIKKRVANRLFSGAAERRSSLTGTKVRVPKGNKIDAVKETAEKNSKSKPASKSQAERDVASSKASLTRLRNIESVYSKMGDLPEEFLALVKDAEFREQRVLEIESQLDLVESDAERKQLLTELGFLTIQSEAVLDIFKKEETDNILKLFKAVAQHKIVVDQIYVDTIISSIEEKLKDESLDVEQRKRYETELEFFKPLSLSLVYASFEDKFLEIGKSREDLIKALSGVVYGKSKSNLFSFEGGKFTIASKNGTGFSISGKLSVAATLKNALGFSDTSGFTEIFPLEGLLKYEGVGHVVVGWSLPSTESVLSEKQQTKILMGEDIEAIKARETASQFINDAVFNESHSFFVDRKKVTYTIDKALSLENDEEKRKTVSALVAHLENKGKKEKKYLYFAENLKNSIGDDGFVKKIFPDDSQLTEEQVERNNLGRLLCDDFADAMFILNSGYDFAESAQLTKLTLLSLLPHFQSAKNPYSTVSRYAISLGVHVKDGELKMYEPLREVLESHFLQNSDENEIEDYNNLSNNEQIVRLVEHFSKNPESATGSMSMFAAARMKSLTGKDNIVVTGSSFVRAKDFDDFTSLPNLPDFITRIKNAIGDEDSVRSECRDAVTKLGFAEDEVGIAERYLSDSLLKYKKAGGNDGDYSEEYVNLSVAKKLGKIVSYEPSNSKEVPSILIIQGNDGKTYHIATHATDSKGFGDVQLVEFAENGQVTLTTLEQKYQKVESSKITPHVGDVNQISEVVNHYEKISQQPVLFNNVAGMFIKDDGSVTTSWDIQAELDVTKSTTAGHQMKGKE